MAAVGAVPVLKPVSTGSAEVDGTSKILASAASHEYALPHVEWLVVKSVKLLTEMTNRDFAEWVVPLTAGKLVHDEAFKKRAYLRALLVANEHLFKPAKAQVESAKEAYMSSEYYPRIEELEDKRHKQELVVEGISLFVSAEEPIATGESADTAAAKRPGARPRARKTNGPASVEKVAKAKEKLAQGTALLNAMNEEFNQLVALCPQRASLDQAKANLARLREELGIIRAENDITALNKTTAKAAFEAGKTLERKSATSTDIFSTLVSLVKNQEKATPHQEDPCQIATRPYVLLRNVQIGMPTAEFDLVLIHTSENPADPVTVDCIVESKTNINDIGKAFAHFQSTLAWLTGKRELYDPSTFKNKIYKTGHFEPVTHVDQASGIKYLFSPTSFRYFEREPVGDLNLFIRKIFFLTISAPLQPVDSSEMGTFLHYLPLNSSLPALIQPELDRLLQSQPPNTPVTTPPISITPEIEQECIPLHQYTLVNHKSLTTTEAFKYYMKLNLIDNIIFLQSL
ncbi:hypothetical protein Pelo_16411 [Pelomyxa schiedti]|nr:hypothetical protein Pelo_16411 [Pelomyxa schiedti]